MILYDTETTGLFQQDAMPLAKQPHCVEFAALKLDDKTLKETAHINFLCRPPIEIPREVIKIHGITNEMVKDCKPFAEYIEELTEFYFGERFSVAHNHRYDLRILAVELEREDKHLCFPFPPRQICTVERTYHFENKRLSLGALYTRVTGKVFKEAHRAIKDIRTLAECVRELRKMKVL